jgi:hypothetical protein
VGFGFPKSAARSAGFCLKTPRFHFQLKHAKLYPLWIA